METFLSPGWRRRFAGLLAEHAAPITAATGGRSVRFRFALSSAPTAGGESVWAVAVHPDGSVTEDGAEVGVSIEAHYYLAWTAFVTPITGAGDLRWSRDIRLSWHPALPPEATSVLTETLSEIRDRIRPHTAPVQLLDADPPDGTGSPIGLYPGSHARTSPEKPAIIMAGTGQTVTYAELDEQSRRLAARFAAAGLRAGDTIAVLLPNHPAYLAVCWAAHRSGLYYVPINHHLTVAETRYILGNCEPKALVAAADYGDMVAGALEAAGGLRLRISVDGPLPCGEPLDEALRRGASAEQPAEAEGAAMIYSSGTTGRPKGGKPALPGTHPAHPDAAALAMYRLFGLDAESRYLVPGAPLYHSAPLRFALAVTRLGGTVVLMESFDAEAALEAIERHRVSHSQWVPTMFSKLLALPRELRRAFDLSSHQVAIHAAAPCPAPVKQRMIEWWGPILEEYYGASEGGGLTRLTPEEWAEHQGSVGRPVLGRFHILDETGREQPSGQVGDIYVEDGIPVAYHGDPVKTAAAYDEHGWVTVGDVGYLDDGGYLYLTDRKDDVIISGGVNIYPQEAENVLAEHPDVLDVAVIGVPNEEFGQEVKAVVCAAPGIASPALAGELVAFCRDRLAHYKCPRTVDLVDELPRTPAGKLLRRRLREDYWSGHATHLV